MDNPLLNYPNTINQELFAAIARDDFEKAQKAAEIGANPNAIFLLEKNVNISSFNLLVIKTAQIGKSKGPGNAQYIASSSLVKFLSKKGSNSATL